MPQITRNQHFVPRFLLAGFTASLTREDRLWVTDLKTDRGWPDKPAKAGYKRKFYDIQKAGLEPDFFDKAINDEIDALAAPIIRNVIDLGLIPARNSEEYEILISFVALLASRVPAMRTMLDAAIDDLGKFLFEQDTKTPERWNRLRGRFEKDTNQEGLSYEDAGCVVEENSVSFTLHQNSHVGMIWKTVEAILPCLLERNWAILTSSSGSLICSDNPVSVSITSGGMTGWYQPGFGVEGAEVTVPLNRYTLLRGAFEPQRTQTDITRRQVAYYNSLRIIQAERFLYANSASFPWLDTEGASRQRRPEGIP
jgi:hypothetical protein